MTPGLPDEALDGNEALRDGIGRQEETLEGHGLEQGRPVRSDEAGRGHFSPVDGDAHFGDGPDFAPAAGGR